MQCREKFTPSDALKPRLLSVGREKTKIGSLLPYSDDVRQIIIGAKDDGNRELERIVIEALLAARTLFPEDLVIVPIPSTFRSRRRRGRDFTFDIARELAQQSGDQILPALQYTRSVAPQKTLNAEERLANMRGALTCREYHREKSGMKGGRAALLLDDVLTTGATLYEGMRAVRAGGRPCLGAITASFSLNWSQEQPQR
jgi:predicted amidophosphoribosyltransferase